MVLAVVDTLRADHLSCFGYRRPTSPGMECVAAESAPVSRSTPSPAACGTTWRARRRTLHDPRTVPSPHRRLIPD